MRKASALAAALLAGMATAATAEVVFVGTVINTAVTAACQNAHVGERYPSVFHPAVVAGNDNFTGLSWIRGHYPIGHFFEGSLDATFRAVETGGVGWGDTYFRPASGWAQIRIISSVPAISSITASTQTLTLRGQIRRFSSDPGGLACIVTFQGVYAKDPWEAPL